MKKLSNEELKNIEGGLKFCCQVCYKNFYWRNSRVHITSTHKLDRMIIETYGVKSGLYIVEWGY